MEDVKDVAVPVHNYKDSVFRMLFSEKERLLGLYNALNGTDYIDPDELEINTLENEREDRIRITEEQPELELKTLVININRGYNEELKQSCRDLYGYMVYVDKVREFAKIYPLETAVEMAIDYCIENNILAELDPIPDEVSLRIQSEKDLAVLSGWLKLAAKSDSMEEFVRNHRKMLKKN